MLYRYIHPNREIDGTWESDSTESVVWFTHGPYDSNLENKLEERLGDKGIAASTECVPVDDINTIVIVEAGADLLVPRASMGYARRSAHGFAQPKDHELIQRKLVQHYFEDLGNAILSTYSAVLPRKTE